MFCCKNISGTCFYKLDSKNRILLPEFAYAEIGDNVVLCHDSKNKFIDVFSSEYYFALMDKYNSIATNTRISENAERVLKVRDKMYLDLQRQSNVDKRRRINIGSRLADMFIEGETAVVVGMKNRVRIFATKSDYNQHIKKLVKEGEFR